MLKTHEVSETLEMLKTLEVFEMPEALKTPSGV
jgi:hypothetical protein